MLDAALTYASRGWLVLPLRPRAKVPATAHGLLDASRDEQQIRAWWAEDASRNVGIATGAVSGIVVVDLDTDEAAATWRTLCEEHGGRLETLAQKTGRGWQVLLAHPGEQVRNSAGRLGPGIDVRGDGGYIVAPPSVHPSGEVYRWANTAPVAPCPAWLLPMLVKPAPAATPRPKPAPRRLAGESSPYGRAALERECATVATTGEGQRNHVLNAAAYACGQLVAGGELDCAEAESALLAAALACGLSEHEATRTLSSGIAAGEREPRQAPERPAEPAYRRAGTDSPPPPDDADAPPEATDGPSWREQLIVTVDKAGNIAIRPVLPNAVLLVRYQPSLAGRLGLDERTATPTWIVPPPWGQGGPPRPVKDADATEASLWLSAAESVVLSHEHLMRAIIAEAERRPYDRFRDYLDAIEWDGSARLSMWLVDHLGAEDSEYTRSVARAWVISAVARVYQPGCQADHVLVLEGPQGCGKTSSLRALAGDEWYAEISLAATRDGVMDLHGPVVCEWAELAGMGRTEMESVKAIISRRVDRLRLPYARLVVDLPRRGILAASTNEAEWATDQSGNRRFWPVRVNDCDPAKVAVVRDQLWAEAVHAYRCGEHWWLGAEATEQAREQQAERLTQDPWLSEIAAAIKGSLAGRKSLQIADVLDAIQVPAAAQTTYAARRAGTCLRALGYVPGYAHDDETGGRRTQRVWVARISSVPESEIRAASVPGSRSTLRLL